jgi:hypothetical protein
MNTKRTERFALDARISHSRLFLLSRVIVTDWECPLSASAIALSLGAGAVADEARDPSVRVAEIVDHV